MLKNKALLIGMITAGVAIVASVVVAVVYFSSDKVESYRSIQVYDLEGKAEIERKGSKIINAVANLYLESEDRVSTGTESNMRLKLDDDKYIMVEEESIFRIEATGDKIDSKTSIYLEKGAITNEIQNKLSKDSYYEVETPNSVMAVRGTIFRIEVYFDINGEIYTKLTVFNGKVTVHLVYPDGTSGEDLSIEGGKEVIIHSDDIISEYLSDPSDINYQDLKLQVLYTLRDLMDNGETIEGISSTELEELIQQLESEEAPEQTPNPTEQPTGEPTAEPPGGSTAQPNAGATAKPTTKPTSNSTAKPAADSTVAPTAKPAAKPTAAPTAAPTAKPIGKPTASPTAEPTAEPDNEKVIHTVTFIYEGNVFGTQQVEDGQKATQPKLKPANEGKWNFDFSQVIKEDTTIEWK